MTTILSVFISNITWGQNIEMSTKYGEKVLEIWPLICRFRPKTDMRQIEIYMILPKKVSMYEATKASSRLRILI